MNEPITLWVQRFYKGNILRVIKASYAKSTIGHRKQRIFKGNILMVGDASITHPWNHERNRLLYGCNDFPKATFLESPAHRTQNKWLCLGSNAFPKTTFEGNIIRVGDVSIPNRWNHERYQLLYGCKKFWRQHPRVINDWASEATHFQRQHRKATFLGSMIHQ